MNLADGQASILTTIGHNQSFIGPPLTHDEYGRLKLKVVTCLSFVGMSIWGSFCHAGTADGLDTQLVGAWQEDLVKDIRSMSPSQQQMYVGNVLVFNVDHRFLTYPKCGREAAAYKAKNLVALSGEWSISSDGSLHLVVQNAGKSIDQGIPITVEGDEMTFGKGTPKASFFGKYDGPLPPNCPSK